MYAVPDVDEVVAVAKELGIHLAPEEAVLYRKYLMEQPATRRSPSPWASRRLVSRSACKLVGRFFDDPLLMRVAYAYQHATDWDKIIGVHA